MTHYILVKKDLFGTILQELTFLQACKYRKKHVPVLELTDEEMQKLIKQEQEQGRKVNILPVQKCKCWWNIYPTEEELEAIRKERELDLLSSIPPTEKEMKEWKNKPIRKTEIF